MEIDPLSDSAQAQIVADHDFFRLPVSRLLALTLGLNVTIALLISLAQHSWAAVPNNLLFSNCIGLSIFVLLYLARLTFMKRLKPGRVWPISVYFALVAVGAVAGNRLAGVITHRDTHGLNLLIGNDGIVAIVFAMFAGAVAIAINASSALLAQRTRDLERAQRIAIESQLRALQAQIEPHFLFNTLANLDALIVTDSRQARTLLGNLIRYLRAALEHARSQTATLQTEVELLKAYLAIMAQRLPNRLTTEYDCDPECLRLAFPAMLVQPLVENAITHGIEPARDGGTISVSVRRSNEMLLISVDDTGVGLGNAHTAGTGAGIQNIRARLKSLFGESAQLTLEARAPHGTHAGIQVPLKLLSAATA